jgi:hypothetical protein
MLDRTGKYPWSRIAARGPLRPIYEQIYRHYVSRMSVDSPMLKAAVDRVRPEGPSRPIGDHPGYGTLLFARLSSTPPKNQQPPTKSPASPSAVIAKGSAAGVDLAWVTSHNASSYVVKRAISSGGPYAAIAKDVPTPAYVDESVEPGTLYYYVVSAANAIGESADSFETGITAGMPGPWKNQDIGDVKLAGWASFDGRSFSVSGAGRNIGGALRDAVGSNDQFHFVYLPLRGDGTITARFVPPMSGMRSKFGLMMRESLSTDSPHVALLIEPSGSNRESPGYSAKFVNRPTAGAAMSEFGQHRVPEPFVSEGRFMEPYWIRLSRTGNTFAAFASIDGDRWVQVARSNDGNNSSVLGGRRGQGSAPSGTMELALNENLFVGIPVCSTILQTVGDTEIAVDTVIKMDNVVATGWTPPPNGRNEE